MSAERPKDPSAPQTVQESPQEDSLAGANAWIEGVDDDYPSQDISDGALDSLLDMLAKPVEYTLPRPGQSVGADGRYLLERRLGRGGQGVVFEAKDERLRRAVAIKFVLPDEDDTAESWRQKCERFEDEIGVLAMLQHEHIVTTHDRGLWEGVPFMVMALLEGQTLRKLLRAKGALDARRAVSLSLQIAHGLGAAHASGVIHRDLKPENVFVQPGDRVKILDFGLAALAARPDDEVLPLADADPTPSEVQQGGTARYMAPEQWRATSQDTRTDVWALGVVLYEMLTGTHPFFGASSTKSLRDAVLNAAPTPLLSRIHRESLPTELLELVSACMKKEARLRPADASAVVTRLESLHHRLQAGPGQVPHTQSLPSIPARPKTTGPMQPVVLPKPPAPKTQRWLSTRKMATIAAVVLVVMGALLWKFGRLYTSEVDFINQVEVKRATLPKSHHGCLPRNWPLQSCVFVAADPVHFSLIFLVEPSDANR